MNGAPDLGETEARGAGTARGSEWLRPWWVKALCLGCSGTEGSWGRRGGTRGPGAAGTAASPRERQPCGRTEGAAEGPPPPAGRPGRRAARAVVRALTGGSCDCLTGSWLLGNARRLITAATVINQKRKKKKRGKEKSKEEKNREKGGNMKVKWAI